MSTYHTDPLAQGEGPSFERSQRRAVSWTVDWRSAVAWTAAVLFLALLAWPMLTWWYWEYTRPDSYYSHAFFIPFLIGVMLWHRRAALRAAPKKPCWAVLILLVPAVALFVVAVRSDMQAVMSWSFLLIVASSLWFTLGTAVVRAAAFPLLFLWLMAPLPGPVLNDATLGMQMLSTVTAGKILQLMAFHPVTHGNIIAMESYTLNVNVPCSGFNLLLRLLTFSAAFAYLTDTTLTRRWALFLVSLPLSLAINALRIALIGVVGECLGTSAARAFHDWSGILTLVLCMAILFGIAKVIGCRRFAGQPIF